MPSSFQPIFFGAASVPKPMPYQPSKASVFFAFFQPIREVTTMTRISRLYQPMKPFPTVMRKIPSGSGSRAWPSWVMKG